MKRKLERYREKAKTIYVRLYDFALEKSSWYAVALDYSSLSISKTKKKERKRSLLSVVREPTPPQPKVMKMENWGSTCSFCVLGSKIYAVGDNSTKVKVFNFNNVHNGWRELPFSLQTPRYVPYLVPLRGEGKIYVFGGISYPGEAEKDGKPWAEVIDVDKATTKALPSPPLFPEEVQRSYREPFLIPDDFHVIYLHPPGYFGPNQVFVAPLDNTAQILVSAKDSCSSYSGCASYSPVNIAFTESSGDWSTVKWKGKVEEEGYLSPEDDDDYNFSNLYIRRQRKWDTYALNYSEVGFERGGTLNGGPAMVGSTFYWYKPKTFQVTAYDDDQGIWYTSRALVGNVMVEGTPVLLGDDWNPILIHVHGDDTFALLWGFLGIMGVLTFRAVKTEPKDQNTPHGYLKIYRISCKVYNIAQCQALQGALLAPTGNEDEHKGKRLKVKK